MQPPAHDDSSFANLPTLNMEAIRPSETSVNTTTTKRHIAEDGILHKANVYEEGVERRENGQNSE
jgi:hypothetical protein